MIDKTIFDAMLPKQQSCPDCLPLAMSYVPMQKWQDLYDFDVGHDRGTIFQQLDLPFLGVRTDD